MSISAFGIEHGEEFGKANLFKPVTFTPTAEKIANSARRVRPQKKTKKTPLAPRQVKTKKQKQPKPTPTPNASPYAPLTNTERAVLGAGVVGTGLGLYGIHRYRQSGGFQ